MTKKTIIYFCLIFSSYMIVHGQEILRPLHFNPAKSSPDGTLKNDPSGPLLLPFKDDFSYRSSRPDPMRWKDSDVFINTTFAVHPKTVGTATFDAMDQHGRIYPEAETNLFQFQADFLTSRAIRLDSLLNDNPRALVPADSILLTFYYQPQGRGSMPRDRDSLVVEFLHTPGHYGEDPEDPDQEIWIDDLWVSMWRAEGQSLESFLKDNDSIFFKRVAIRIDDEIYLRDDFQFRFRNYASFPITKTPDNFGGNTSIWNVDYVTLDYGRSIADSFYYDLAFAAPAQSVLRDFQSMPWSHYITNPQAKNRSSFDVAITNLDNVTHNYSYRYFVMDEGGNIVRNYTGGTRNINPFYQDGYQSFEPHSNPIVVPNPFGNPPYTPAPAREFRVFHVIREGATGDDWPYNDTIMFRQVFDNYFAYDNGIPEVGYGLVGFNARGAVRFVLSHTDTLEAVQFFFNSTLFDQNERPFLLTVWKDLHPEEILYQSDPVSVEYGQWLNQFVTYKIDPPLVVSDTIYVGWQQLSNEFLNIGFDAVNDASQHIFYNSHGEWLPTIYQGALMIRPVFGAQLIANVNEPEKHEQQPVLYPNPVRHNTLNIQPLPGMEAGFSVEIFDATGRQVAVFNDQQSMDVSHLNNGIYILRIQPRNGTLPEAVRFIIAR